MPDRQQIEPVLIALNSEKRAIEYYARAARRITNIEGKTALQKLKRQEERHFKSLKDRFKKLVGRDPKSSEIEKVNVSISSLTEEHLADREASDLEVCQIALKDEKDAHDFYLRSAAKTPDPDAKKLYEELAREEKNHAAVVRTICKIVSKNEK